MEYENKEIVPTFISFNDEAGDWNNEKELFYVRVSVIINTLDIKKIEREISDIRNKNELNIIACEIKWQDLWLIRRYFNKNNTPKDTRLNQIYTLLRNKNKDYHLLIDYCSKILELLNKYNLTIIATFSSKNKCKHKEKDIIKFHIQDHLQRIQMQFSDSVILIVYDSAAEKKQKMFKEIHKNLIIEGDFVEYSSISETLLFDHSYDNYLLQMADFVAGAFRNTLVSIIKNDSNNYKKAVEFFKEYIYPNLAKDKNGNVWGVGVKETPKNDVYRNEIKQRIESSLRMKI